MTDTTFENLDTLVGELKQAAIDAYMAKEGWHIDGESEYHLGDCNVTRPASDGSGGGDWDLNGFFDIGNDGQDAKWRENFDTIRGRVDSAVAKWRYLPHPDTIEGTLESKMRLVNGRLAVGTVSTDGTVTGAGSIAGNLNLAMENSDAMAGGMITAFKANFMSQLGRAIGGHHAITVILGGVIASERKMWEGARQGVADIVAGARDACRAAADQGGGEWGVILKVAGYAVSGASIFATGGAATGLAVAGLGLEIAEGATGGSDTSTEKPDLDYDSIMTSFEKAFVTLDETITSEEELLEQNLTKNLNAIRAQKGSYDLTRPAVIDIADDSDLGEIYVNRTLALEITGTYLPNVATEVQNASVDAWAVSDLSAFMRDPAIGVGQYGPSSLFHEMRWLMQELLDNLGVETQYAAKALDLGIRDMQVTDTGAQDALEKHHAEVVGAGVGTGPDPWNEY